MFWSWCVNKSKENIYYLKRNIKFEDGPEPEDIWFENLEFSSVSRIARTFGIYIISLLFCELSIVIVMALTNLQQKIDSENTIGALSFMYLLSLAITVVTCVIDVILEMVFEIFKKNGKSLQTGLIIIYVIVLKPRFYNIYSYSIIFLKWMKLKIKLQQIINMIL